MANNEILDSSETHQEVGIVLGTHLGGDGFAGLNQNGTAVEALENATREPSPVSASPASALASLRASPANGLPSGGSSTLTLNMPHPKKFTHSNINKKFLEKTSSASSSGQTSSTSVTAKVGNSIQKPVLQTPQSHSRLVTTKLTATPQPSTTIGPGWSRPPSVPSGAGTPASAPHQKASSLPSPSAAAPQPTPVGGKIIQPQPRGASEVFVSVVKREGLNKPAWGNNKGATAAGNPDTEIEGFPTAAEVAHGHKTNISDRKQDAATAVTSKATYMEDTFRGTHLDPKAHHWDEMEEDDDNFLGGIIEFEDGRQYKVQSTDGVQQASVPRELPESATDVDADSTRQPETTSSLEKPVPKEERFVDDFDRSWPPSRHDSSSHSRDPGYSNGRLSSMSSHSMHSPQDSPRVLFNERLGRLEPYSGTSVQHRQSGGPQLSHFMRRGSRSDYNPSPTESRGGRDMPPHVNPQGIQLLQKAPGSGFDARSDSGRSREHGEQTHPSPTFEQHRFRDREPQYRDAPFLTRTSSHGFQGRSRDAFSPHGAPGSSRSSRESEDHPRRTSTMGPPPLPLSSPNDSIRDMGRQLPPHLAVVHPPPTEPPQSSQDGNSHIPAPSATTSAPPLKSPLTPHSPNQVPLTPSTLPLVDIEEVRKAAMHSAAERARERRKHEEEEREKERERARKKAAELEARLKAETASKQTKQTSEPVALDVTEAQVQEILEQAAEDAKSNINGATTIEALAKSPQLSSSRPAFARSPSTRDVPRPTQSRRTTFQPRVTDQETPSQATEADSWRAKAPRRPSPAEKDIVATISPATSLLTPIQSLDVHCAEDLDVVDFSELGRLVGAEQPKSAESQEPTRLPRSSRPPRAVATDFFGDETTTAREPPQSTRNDQGSWRRKPPSQNGDSTEASGSAPPARPQDRLRIQTGIIETSLMNVSPTNGLHLPPPHGRHVDDSPGARNGFMHPPSTSHQQGAQRPPSTPSYREAPMSTLDDTMSRIKVALNDMHVKSESPPPALRPKQDASDMPLPTEVFDITCLEPPRSPKSAWNTFLVKLPQISHAPRPEVQTKPRFSQRPTVFYTEIYSWSSSVAGNDHRSLSMNEVLFQKPVHHEGRPRYHVSVPHKRRSALQSISEEASSPIVNLPSKATNSRNVDTVSNWRKPVSARSQESQPFANTQVNGALDTVSRSPPPEAPSSSSNTTSISRTATNSSQQAKNIATKPKAQSKMPAGSDVAFYRDTTDTSIQPKSKVTFIVSSELDETRLVDGGSSAQESTAQAENITIVELSSRDMTIQEVDNKTKIESSSVVSTDTSASPPLTNSSLHTKSPRAFPIKDSPSRAPDPEHLKAVWSQTADQTELPSINSLEGIADDLTAVPFTLQEVKSEDGGTPPPTASGPPSRMSIHDVTRAFQQVPPSSDNSPHRGTTLPPPLSSQHGNSAPRPPYSYAPSMPGTGLRSVYPYPSPMLSHAPSPAIYPSHIAPSPIPRPMVVSGPPSPYGQPIWVPVAGPATPTAGPVMRPMTSSYPAQYMPYPSHNGTVHMYAPPPTNVSSQQPNAPQGRTSMPVLSPAMQPAHANLPMYASSPVLMHSPAIAPRHTYPGVPTPSRGPIRGTFDHAPGVPVSSPSVTHTTPPSNTYPVPPSFSRPGW